MIVFVYLVEFLILHLFLSSVQCVYVISGITADVDASNGRRPIRPNIQSFQYSGPAWDLYILALHQFMQLDPSNPESYYRIAGN